MSIGHIRIMRGNIIKIDECNLHLKRFSRISLSCKLVPVQYEYGLLPTEHFQPLSIEIFIMTSLHSLHWICCSLLGLSTNSSQLLFCTENYIFDDPLKRKRALFRTMKESNRLMLITLTRVESRSIDISFQSSQ